MHSNPLLLPTRPQHPGGWCEQREQQALARVPCAVTLPAAPPGPPAIWPGQVAQQPPALPQPEGERAAVPGPTGSGVCDTRLVPDPPSLFWHHITGQGYRICEGLGAGRDPIVQSQPITLALGHAAAPAQLCLCHVSGWHPVPRRAGHCTHHCAIAPVQLLHGERLGSPKTSLDGLSPRPCTPEVQPVRLAKGTVGTVTAY